MRNMKKRVFFAVIAAVLFVCGCAHGFSDVRSSDWYYTNVTEMTENGYLRGYEDGTFRPSGVITKAELVSIVCRMANVQTTAAVGGHWAKGAMDAALAQGWYDWDEIPPTGETYDEPITRQVAVKIVMKAFLPDARGDYNHVSSSVSDFARLDGRYYDTVLAAYDSGVVVGDGGLWRECVSLRDVYCRERISERRDGKKHAD